MSCLSARYQDYEDDWVDFTSVEFTVLQKRCQGSQPSQNQSESQLKKRSGKLPSLNSSQRFSPLKGPKVENGETKVKRKVLKKVTRAARRDFFFQTCHGTLESHTMGLLIFVAFLCVFSWVWCIQGEKGEKGDKGKRGPVPWSFVPLCAASISVWCKFNCSRYTMSPWENPGGIQSPDCQNCSFWASEWS